MDNGDLSLESNAAKQGTWVVKTKLFPPILQNTIVTREHLIHQLHQSATTIPVTLISAPAGYGKTTLISTLCHTQAEMSIAWLSLDDDDNDSVQFLVDLIAAFQQAVPDCAETTQNLLSSLTNPATNIRQLAGVLINDVFQSGVNPLVLILDDLHVIHETRALEVLDYLIDHLPENLYLVIATRYDPPLSLARTRARGHLAEFRSNNLRFSQDEVDRYLNQKLGLGLAPESVMYLETRTEGWVAVLRLLAISLSRIANQNERDALIRRLPTTEQHVFDFLAEEILNQQGPQSRKFLLETSILTELRDEVCEVVTGQQNAAEILDELYRNNLIQIAAGKETDHNYRYHDLLAGFLRTRLEREYTSEKIHRLHRLAAEAQPGTSFSINHYLKAERWDDAALAIQLIGQKMIYMGLYDKLIDWINALPQQTIDEHPQLDYFLGISAFQRGEFENAQKLVTRALAGFEASKDEAKTGEAILILGAIASGFHDIDRGAKLLGQALSYPLSLQMKIMAHINRAWVGVYSNDWELVEEDVTSAIQLALKSEEKDSFYVLAPHLTAVLLFMPNGVKRLKEYCTQVLAWFGDDVGLVQVGSNALLGVIHLMEGDLHAGQQALERARKGSDLLGGFVWLDIGIDFGLLQHALIRADYRKFERYWQNRLAHYQQKTGAREYLTSYLYVKGRVLYYQNRINEAQEIYARMLAIEQTQDIPESQLTRALMGAMLMISEKQYPQAESLLQQVASLQQQSPHSVLFGNASALLAALYLHLDQPEAALTELHKLLSVYERRNMLGLLLTEGIILIPVLKLALEKSVCIDQTTW